MCQKVTRRISLSGFTWPRFFGVFGIRGGGKQSTFGDFLALCARVVDCQPLATLTLKKVNFLGPCKIQKSTFSPV